MGEVLEWTLLLWDFKVGGSCSTGNFKKSYIKQQTQSRSQVKKHTEHTTSSDRLCCYTLCMFSSKITAPNFGISMLNTACKNVTLQNNSSLKHGMSQSMLSRCQQIPLVCGNFKGQPTNKGVLDIKAVSKSRYLQAVVDSCGVLWHMRTRVEHLLL